MTIYDRFYSIYGFAISIFYGIWVVITATFNAQLWVVLVLPLPIMLVIFLISDFIRHIKKSKKVALKQIDEYNYPIHEY